MQLPFNTKKKKHLTTDVCLRLRQVLHREVVVTCLIKHRTNRSLWMQCFISKVFLKLYHQMSFQHCHLKLQHNNNDACLFSKIKAKPVPRTRICLGEWGWRLEVGSGGQKSKETEKLGCWLTRYYFLEFSNQTESRDSLHKKPIE